MKHAGRAHSKFSASGSERWINCPGSVALSEGRPSRDSVWSIEGTRAHEILELLMRWAIETGALTLGRRLPPLPPKVPREMIMHGISAADFILKLHAKLPYSELMIETRIYLDFIHPEMFGTFDSAVLDHFGTLHVFDYKYGAGVAVSPVKNLQMIFYGIGVAHRYGWNFERVRLWIVQPRVKGYDGPLFWDLTIEELKRYVEVFRKGVRRVEREPKTFVEGSWCHWCNAKGVCPKKTEGRMEKAISVFTAAPLMIGN